MLCCYNAKKAHRSSYDVSFIILFSLHKIKFIISLMIFFIIIICFIYLFQILNKYLLCQSVPTIVLASLPNILLHHFYISFQISLLHLYIYLLIYIIQSSQFINKQKYRRQSYYDIQI